MSREKRREELMQTLLDNTKGLLEVDEETSKHMLTIMSAELDWPTIDRRSEQMGRAMFMGVNGEMEGVPHAEMVTVLVNLLTSLAAMQQEQMEPRMFLAVLFRMSMKVAD